jgi:CheY-like chemotaxis protein
MSALVLVVDDDFLVRMNAVFLLEEAGFGTLQAGTAEEAIGLLETRSDIEVVFTDINMPERGLFLGKPYQPAELVRMVQSLTR